MKYPIKEILKSHIGTVIPALAVAILVLVCNQMSQGANFRQIGVAEGLSSREVYEVAQDSAGYVWAYTHAGIDRYDGSQIKHYSLKGEPDSKDYMHAFTTLLTDSNGCLWISLKNGRVYSYDRRKDEFLLRLDLREKFPDVSVYHAAFDAEDHLWLGSDAGLYEWNEEVGVLPRGLAGKWVKSIAIAPNGHMYIGTSEGIYVANNNATSHQIMLDLIEGTQGLNVESMWITDRYIWAGTYDSGTWIMDRENGILKHLPFVPNVPVRVFDQMPDGTLVIGVDGAGVFCVDSIEGSLREHYMASEDNPNSIAGNTISDLWVDHEGGLWVSTSTNGINYLPAQEDEVRRYAHQIKNANSLRSNHVNVVMEDSDGDYWFGTNDGVSLYRTATDRWQHFLADEEHNAKVVLTLAQCPGSQDVWVGGYGIGVYCIDKDTGHVTRMPSRSADKANGMPTDYINAIYEHDGLLWIGGIEGGLAIFNPKDGTCQYFPSDCIDIIKPGPDGSVVIGGCSGFAIWHPGESQLKWLKPDGDQDAQYPVSDAVLSHDGCIWLATDGTGLFKYDQNGQLVASIGQDQGIDSNAISNLIEDKYGRLWFTTEQNLYCFDQSQDRLIKAQGMLSSPWGYYNPRSSAILSDGSLMLGTAEGAIQFMPYDKMQPIEKAKLIITDFKILYESVGVGQADDVLSQNIEDTQRIKLPRNQNSFSISFSTINFTTPTRICYEYRLIGKDDGWTQCDNASTVHFTDLQPGKYIFELRAFDRWTGQPIGERQLQIIVRSPIWTSWWAISLLTILLLVLGWVVFQNLRHRTKEKLIKEKMQSFVNLAHDIRTPVSLIKAPLSEMMTDSDVPQPCKERLDLALKNADKLQTMVGNLLTLQKAELRPDEKLPVREVNLAEYASGKIKEYELMAIQKDLQLKANIDTKVPKVWMNTRKIDRLLDNLITNAIRYTPRGEITVSVKSDERTWSIAVSDTGIGIPKEEQKRVFDAFYRAKNAIKESEAGSGVGLIIAQSITRQHGGTLNLESLEGYGTTFTALFTNRYNPRLMMVDEVPAVEDTTKKTEAEEPEAEKESNVLLIAEDNEELRNYLAKSLGAEYQIIEARDGKEALRQAQEKNPDLVLSDVDMPVMRGDEMCRELKSAVETSHIPVVLLTGLGERENIISGLQAGANDYIVKPFDLPELRLRLRNLLGNREKLRKALVDSEPTESALEECDNTLDREFLDKVHRVINDQIGNIDFSMADFCQELGMSRTSVYNKVRALTGRGPNDYIRIMRLNRAHELLLTKRYNVSEVSLMVGFADPKYFSTCFKKKFGVLPSKI